MKKILLILIITAAIITISIIFMIINTKTISAYGTIKQSGNGYVIDVQLIDCELNSKTLIIINPGIIINQINKSMQVNGQALLDYLTINSINETYEPKSACFAKHESDIVSSPLNYKINPDIPEVIAYNITNNQDQRLFYNCKLLTDCNLSRTYFTGYLSPGEYVMVNFNITCPAGIHNSTVNTLFVDELTNRHTILQEITINAE